MAPARSVISDMKKSIPLLIVGVIIASVVIIIAVFGISVTLFHLTGIDGATATLNNYNDAQWEEVVFTESHPVPDSQGSWDVYYLSTDGREFYTNTKIASRNVNLQLFQDYDVLDYKIELAGFPDNAWGIKAAIAVEQHPTGEAGTN
ncbi:MAG TPA: hypothetical protein VMC42_10160 [Methanoregulaceae archaeon]|nr:hypothetical protein [Methanoregulaceae archaeon]